MASRTSEYYKKNPAARRRRLKQQSEYQKRPGRVKKRVELNRINRKVGTYGKETVKMSLTALTVKPV